MVIKEDYTKNKMFWVRLHAFVLEVQVNDPCSEEEQEMILNVAEYKIELLTQ